MATPCLFCQRNRPLTREHLWSDWVNDIYPDGEHERYTFRKERSYGEPREWKRVGLDEAAALVCAECNNGWMSNIEALVKPILSPLIRFGCPMSFLPSGVAVLAAFTLKNAIIADHMHRDRKPFFSVHDRIRFMKTLRIPEGAQIWIASSGSDRFNGIFHAYAFRCGAPSGVLRRTTFFSFTWSSGYVVLQVLIPRWRKHPRHGEGLPLLKPDAKWDDASIRFWPNDGRPVTWNPAYDLSGDSLNVFKNRWQAPVRILAG